MATSQKARVLAVLQASDVPLALFEIRDRIEAQFMQFDSDAAISARIRDIRHELEVESCGTVGRVQVPGRSWCRYQLVRNGSTQSTTFAADA